MSDTFKVPHTAADRAGVGWRDRDWGKFDEREWEALLGGHGSTVVAQPAQRRGRRFVSGVVALISIVSFGATVGVDAFHRLSNHTAAAAAPPAHVVRIRWSDTDVAPSSSAGRICLNDASIGRVCANYAAGEKPADVLTRQLETLGLTVESAG